MYSAPVLQRDLYCIENQKTKTKEQLGAKMDELTDYFGRAKDYISTAKETAKEHICNAKEYFYANYQTDSM